MDKETASGDGAVLVASQLARLLGVGPEGVVVALAYRSRPLKWFNTIVITVVPLAVWAAFFAAVPPSEFTTGPLWCWLLPASGLLLAAHGAVPRLRRVRVAASVDGLVTTGWLGRRRFSAWVDVSDSEVWCVDCGNYAKCFKVTLPQGTLYLPSTAEAERIVRAAHEVVQAKRRGASVPGSPGTTPLPGLAALSLTVEAGSPAADQARALSPADPPDQLTESEDA